MKKFLDAVAVDTTSAAFVHHSGKFLFVAYGTFGGGSVQLEWSPDGTNWFAMGTALTANGVEELQLPEGSFRAVFSGSAPTPALTAGVDYLD